MKSFFILSVIALFAATACAGHVERGVGVEEAPLSCQIDDNCYTGDVCIGISKGGGICKQGCVENADCESNVCIFLSNERGGTCKDVVPQ